MTPRLRRSALPALAALLLALAASCSGPGGARPAAAPTSRPPLAERVPASASPALQAYYDQRLAWAPCDGGGDPGSDGADPGADPGSDGDQAAPAVPAAPAAPIAQCATLKTPLDYADPGGRSIDVAVVRVPAADPAHRIGALLVNPGGPGNSGTNMARSWKDSQGPLRDRFDVVGFDPRGAGGTLPIDCMDDATREQWMRTDDPAYDHGRVLADACQAKYADILPFLGTRNSARDMDVLRSALGERKLDFLGLSYGTYLGALYAEEFPDRTGRLVLDGAVERSTDLMHLNLEQAAATEAGFRAFATACTAEGAGCPLGTDPGAAPRRLADFLDGLKDHPLPTHDGRTVTAALGWGTVIDTLSDGRGSWSRLRSALDPALTRGEGDELLRFSDGSAGRDDDGHYENSADAYAAIHCADAPLAPTEADQRAALADLAARAPLTSRHDTRLALLDPDCRAWPYRSTERPHTVTAPGSAPILVIGGTEDPVTPYLWAQRMAAGLQHGVLLTRDGDGHMSWYHSSCARDAAAAYLLNGVLPAAGARCGSD
ncbi:alpha/beta hydrolase [Kitasatospora sp. NPDC058162]|uniref:alpha/beta hydrolase n=1 Tax=Kitasatospora sp. NPDC058162 TaxID=3346362 RepID=UPI0036DAD573